MNLTYHRLDLRLTHRWTVASSLAQGGKNIYPTVFVALRDADGVIGFGEAAPSNRYHETADTCAEFLARIDAARLSFDDLRGSMAYIESLAPGNYSPKGAINIALLDGAAKKAHEPLHQFLGLGFAEDKHVTSFTIGLDTADVIRLKVQEAAALPILKLKVGGPDDAENLAAVREIAPNKKIRVDANEAWTTKEQALERIEWLARDPQIEFIEQPMPTKARAADFTWLKERSPLPIMADESYLNANDLPRCADCFHAVNVKLCKTGGITRGFEALAAARKAGLKTMLGCMIESSVLTSAGAHLAELTDWLDLDGNLLITNDPFAGVTSENGVMSFAAAAEPFGLRVRPR
ncbi:MAG TPA: dipeptide epimerase [Candidatus Limnocylindria bacterium]|nr:dipeptide epimerase [Candidatus Limnocylindria bacterium]